MATKEDGMSYLTMQARAHADSGVLQGIMTLTGQIVISGLIHQALSLSRKPSALCTNYVVCTNTLYMVQWRATSFYTYFLWN